MGAACSGQNIPRKVLLTGTKGSGKTTLLYHWCLDKQTETVPTDSFNVEMFQAPRGPTLLIWDVTDPTRRRQFYHGTDAIVYVFGEELQHDPSHVTSDLKTLLTDRDLLTLPLLIVYSQHDQIGRGLSNEKIEKTINLPELMEQRHYACVTVSKDNAQSYSDALNTLCDIMLH